MKYSCTFILLLIFLKSGLLYSSASVSSPTLAAQLHIFNKCSEAFEEISLTAVNIDQLFLGFECELRSGRRFVARSNPYSGHVDMLEKIENMNKGDPVVRYRYAGEYLEGLDGSLIAINNVAGIHQRLGEDVFDGTKMFVTKSGHPLRGIDEIVSFYSSALRTPGVLRNSSIIKRPSMYPYEVYPKHISAIMEVFGYLRHDFKGDTSAIVGLNQALFLVLKKPEERSGHFKKSYEKS